VRRTERHECQPCRWHQLAHQTWQGTSSGGGKASKPSRDGLCPKEQRATADLEFPVRPAPQRVDLTRDGTLANHRAGDARAEGATEANGVAGGEGADHQTGVTI
jgi:hypothetical protein